MRNNYLKESKESLVTPREALTLTTGEDNMQTSNQQILTFSPGDSGVQTPE